MILSGRENLATARRDWRWDGIRRTFGSNEVPSWARPTSPNSAARGWAPQAGEWTVESTPRRVLEPPHVDAERPLISRRSILQWPENRERCRRKTAENVSRTLRIGR